MCYQIKTKNMFNSWLSQEPYMDVMVKLKHTPIVYFMAQSKGTHRYSLNGDTKRYRYYIYFAVKPRGKKFISW